MEAHELEQAPAATRRTLSHGRSDGAGPPAPATAPGQLTPAAVLHLQRLAGNESVSALLDEVSPVRDVVGSGGGSPIDPATRSFMEDRLGHDFSDVRIHTGGRADESARSIDAQAYTVGSDIVMRGGAYEPDSAAGQRLLAHELAHVVQQKAGPVAGTPAPGGIRISDPSDPFEQAAERAADGVAAGGPVAPVPAAAAAPVQRQGEEEEEAVQAMLAQRQAEGAELAEEEEELPEQGGG